MQWANRRHSDHEDMEKDQQASGSGDVVGFAGVSGSLGWKPAIKVCILSGYCHIRHVVCSIHLLGSR